jgi:putative transposase
MATRAIHFLGAFGHRLRQAGLLGSMGRVASVDNAMIESFWSTM